MDDSKEQAVTSNQVTPKQSLAIPAAIVVGFGLIATAIYFSGNQATLPSGGTVAAVGEGTPEVESLTPIPAVSATDHVRGNPQAEIMIVEYSDYDCPFCQRFHNTMKDVLGQFGASGEVAWTYRHFPLQQLHPNAPTIAHAGECVAELSGNDTFWNFSDQYYAQQGQISDFLAFVSELGVDQTAFSACMDEQRHIDTVREQLNEAVAAGGNGTPYNVFIFAEPMNDGLRQLVKDLNLQTRNSLKLISDTQLGMSGAFPIEMIEQIITAYRGLSL